MNIYKLVIYMVQCYKVLRIIEDKKVRIVHNWTIQQGDKKTDTKRNYRRLSVIELPCTLREGLSLDIRRLS